MGSVDSDKVIATFKTAIIRGTPYAIIYDFRR